MHRPQLRIEICPPPIPRQRHRQPTVTCAFTDPRSLGPVTRPLDPHHPSLTTRPLHRIRLHHRVILLKHPPLIADIRTRQQLLQISRIVPRLLQLLHHPSRRIHRHRSLPHPHRPVIQRSIIRQRLIRNIRHQLPPLRDHHIRLLRHLTDDRSIQPPLRKHIQHLTRALLVSDQQHPLLRLRQHNLVARHPRLALRHAIQLDRHPQPATRTHLASRARQPRRTHILNPQHRAR